MMSFEKEIKEFDEKSKKAGLEEHNESLNCCLS
jgi:hypothetical protein